MTSDSQAFGAARMVIADKAGKSISFLVPKSLNSSMLDYRQFSSTGEQIFQKDLDLTGFSEGTLNGINSRLYLLLNESLTGYEGKLRNDTWLAVHPVDSSDPDAVLHEERYRNLQKMQRQIGATLI
jgi:hypothetical protein